MALGIDFYKCSATEPTETPNPAQTIDHVQLINLNQNHQFLTRLNSFNSDLFRSRTNTMISTASSIGEDIYYGTNKDNYGDINQIDDHIEEMYQNDKKHSSWRIYSKYTRMGAGFILITIILCSNILTQLLYTGTDYWLSIWTDYKENEFLHSLNENHTLTKNILITESDSMNQIIYSIIIILLFIITFIRTTSYFVICMKASVNLHNSIFRSLIQAPIVFFDKTPVGIIMNRVSRDLSIIDDLLPPVGFEALEIILNSLAVLVLCAIFNYSLLIPLSILAILFYLLIKFYIQTARNIKRLEASARSPLFNQMASTLSGLPTIRSYAAQEIFIEKFIQRQNVHSSVLFTFLSCGRIFGILMELMCLVYIYLLIIFLIVNIDYYSSSIIALTISQSLSLTSAFNWGVRQMLEVETYMTSVERIIEFGNLDKENIDDGQITPNHDWPPRGDIVFKNVSLQYDPNESFVLKDLNFSISGGEMIGIVGRTGAGKSSIITTLFRLTQPFGTIYIDGIDTANISLSMLRKNLAIIPQEPILFSGNIRGNLDPFNERTDDELWDAIEKVQLKSKIFSLDSPVSESGSDFSVGQKQLICLARALLRRNKILILDEATANVDPRFVLILLNNNYFNKNIFL